MKQFNPLIEITEEVAAYTGFQEKLTNVITIQKNEQILSSILEKATSAGKFGALSPSGLIAYKECSLKFYFRYGAHLKETKEVEEGAEANTFGSILHLSLEKLYQPYTNKIIHATDLTVLMNQIEEVVNESFISFFDNHAPAGKSLLQQEVIKVYLKKLVKNDIKFVAILKEQNQYLTINALENEFSASLIIKTKLKSETVYIKGKIDRIDSYGGITRVIDYKSSVKESDKFMFVSFEKLFYDKNYNKQLQLMIYAWLLYKNNFTDADKIRPCVFPFKTLTEPIYVLESSKKPFVLNGEFLAEFEIALINFIETVFDTAIPFDQTSDTELHKYCPYNTICNFAD